jgi:O-antigen ligase
MAARPLPLLSPPVVALLAAGAATMAGLLIAVRPALGIGFVAALGFVPVALMNLPLALVLWTPIPFIQYLPAVSIAPTFASLVVVAAWLGSGRDRRVATNAGEVGLARRAPLVLVLLALIVWVTMSIALSEDYGRGLAKAGAWYTAALIFVILVTTLRTARSVRLILGAFVFGAVLSVSIGLVATGLSPVDSAIETSTYTEGRLKGGSSDPNYLAAGIVPAIVLAAALAATTRSLLWKWALGVSIGILAIGLAATQSRGGFLALLFTAVAALVLLRRHRVQIMAGFAVFGGMVALMLAVTPGAWERVTSLDGGGNGRSDLWTVAWRIGQEHPVAGVGISDFQAEAHRFVRRPGQITEAALIVDKPHVAHNTYLQVLTELGWVGLTLFLALMAAFLSITYRASRLLAARGEHALATLGGALFVAQISWLVALVFISAGNDQRLWVLLALGVVLRGVAARIPEPLAPAAR